MSYLQQDLSILQESAMRYDVVEESMISQQSTVNDALEENSLQGLVANQPWLEDLSPSQSIQKLLLSFNQAVCERLDAIERRLDSVNEFCQTLEEKVEVLSSLVRESSNQTFISSAGKTEGTLASPTSTSSEDSTSATALPLGPNFTIINLNSEADYPNGSWLGDETNPDNRVRTHISPTELFHINMTCQTAEKMALTLLDYLFDRETQACSNISGTGKHKKKQLDPLLIYGIRCHLVYKFNISPADWNRIKQNIDSKCRTAFRRKQKGLPLLKGQMVSPVDSIEIMDESRPTAESDILGSSTSELPDGECLQLPSHCVHFSLQPSDDQDLLDIEPNSQVIQTSHGSIRVLHATAEQIAQIQQTHQLQVISSGHLLATPVQEQCPEDPLVKSELPQSLDDTIISSSADIEQETSALSLS